jgi:CheY-like chemotaxis protein
MFSIEVPRVASAEVLRIGRTLDVASAQRLDGAFVVIVDDDAQSRFAMGALFKELGCHVLSADSAAEAIDKLRGHLRTPDLIVSDYRLRNSSTGAEAIRDLRAFTEADIPALIVTGDVSVAQGEGPSGADLAVLHKPVGTEQLLRRAARLLEREESP